MDSTNQVAISFKIFFRKSNEFRRFRMETRPTYLGFIDFMAKQYPSMYHPELILSYLDEEGDDVNVSSQIEWQEMFEELKREKLIKINVCEGKTGSYFKDGPEPVLVNAYTDVIEKKPVEIPDPSLQSRLSRCLQELFHGKKILPHHIPSFLEGVVTPLNISEREVDLDVDVAKLHKALFREGYNLIENKEYLKGRNIYRALLILDPKDYLAVYNLACAESLLGNVQESLLALEKAFNLGYTNVEHMLVDPDLSNLHGNPVFAQLVARSSGKETNTEKPVCKEPVKLPVPLPLPALVPVPTIVPSIDQQPKPVPVPLVAPSVERYPLPDVPLQVLPRAQPAQGKWATQLAVLHEFGYFDDELLVSCLERTKGDIQRTVFALIGDN